MTYHGIDNCDHCGRPLEPDQRLCKSCQTNDEFEVVPFFGPFARLNAHRRRDCEMPLVREAPGGQDPQAAILQRCLPEPGVAKEEGRRGVGSPGRDRGGGAEDTAGGWAGWRMKSIVLDSSRTVRDTEAPTALRSHCNYETGAISSPAATPRTIDGAADIRTPSRAEHGPRGRSAF